MTSERKVKYAIQNRQKEDATGTRYSTPCSVHANDAKHKSHSEIALSFCSLTPQSTL